MNAKASFAILMMGLGLILLDSLGFLITSIIGKIFAENNNMKDSHYAMLLIPVYIGVGLYFLQMVWNRWSKMNTSCGLLSIFHLIGDLGEFALQFLIILGVCLSLIKGDILSEYNFGAVVLVYGIFMFFSWLRQIIGGFTEIGIYDWEFFQGNDIRPEDEEEGEEFAASATFLFKRDESGFSINKRNYTQMGDWCRLFISIACLAVWKDFDDLETMASDLRGVFIATMVYAGVNFVYSVGLYVYLKRMMNEIGDVPMPGNMMNFIFNMILIISTLKGFLVAVLIGTLYAAAHYLRDESPMVFDYSIALSALLVLKISMWAIMLSKIHSVAQSLSQTVNV